MNERFQEQLNKAIKSIESRKQSEKLIVMLMLLAGLILGYLSVFYDPISLEKSQIDAQIANVERQIQAQQTAYAGMMATSQEDPSSFAIERIRVITAELEALDNEIVNLAGDLVSPSEMTQILTTVLNRYSGLELISFQNKEAAPLYTGIINTAAPTGEEASSSVASRNIEGQVFSHGLMLEFQGDFLSTLKYLKLLEDISGSFFWDTLSFRQTVWPSAHVILEIHTLSTEAGFIGV